MHWRVGLDHRVPRWPATGHRRADRRQRHRAAPLLSASSPRCSSGPVTNKGQRVTVAMQDGVLDLCRVKLRDQQRLGSWAADTNTSQYGEGIPFGERRPRGAPANDLGRRPARLDLEVHILGRPIPNAYIYFITQAPVWGIDLQGDRAKRNGSPMPISPSRTRGCHGCKADLRPRSKLWTMTKDQVRGHGHPQRIRHTLPAQILSMKELAEEQSFAR